MLGLRSFVLTEPPPRSGVLLGGVIDDMSWFMSISVMSPSSTPMGFTNVKGYATGVLKLNFFTAIVLTATMNFFGHGGSSANRKSTPVHESEELCSLVTSKTLHYLLLITFSFLFFAGMCWHHGCG
jgi:hypothetical protein